MHILYYPEPALQKKAKPIEDIISKEQDLREKAERMLELMYEASGIGLAANQVGWLERLIVKDETGERTGDRIFINPQLIHQEGELLEEEGCLSIPGVFGKVVRAKKVVVAAYNLRGERVEMAVEDLPARVWQHEIDHLNGVLIIDRMTPASRFSASRRLKELEEMHREGRGKIRTL